MTERDVVAATPSPRTRTTLAADLRHLGLAQGATVLVHCSLSALGWVSGGAVAVVEALRDALGPAGTLVMPAQSADLTDPGTWRSPAVPLAWQQPVRDSLPAYDPRTTPSRGMGAVAELFRTWPGVRRSSHPVFSFAALGPQADRITREQPLEDPFGEASPLGCLDYVGADILLLGVGFDRCTAFHLAERRAWPDRTPVREGSPVLVNGERRWMRYTVPPLDPGPFPAAGAFLADAGICRTGLVGSASSYLFPVGPALHAVVALWQAGTRKG